MGLKIERAEAGFLKGSLRATQRLENFGQSFSKLSRERGEEDGLLECCNVCCRVGGSADCSAVQRRSRLPWVECSSSFREHGAQLPW
eukprot:2031888-Amphidinium_carterae.1